MNMIVTDEQAEILSESIKEIEKTHPLLHELICDIAEDFSNCEIDPDSDIAIDARSLLKAYNLACFLR